MALAGCLVAMTATAARADLLDQVLQKATPDKLIFPAVEFLVLLPLAFLIEGMAVGWKNCSLHRILFARTKWSRVDCLFYGICLLRLPRVLLGPLTLASITGLALLGNGILAQYLGIQEYTRIDNPVLGALIFWLVRDFAYYWHHRMQHWRVMWPLHRLHHGAREMNVVTVYRNNVLSDIFLGWMLTVPLSLFLLPESSIIAGQFILVFHGYLQHCEWRSDWGFVGRWLVQSPLHHRLHHGRRQIEVLANYATLPIWDRLFGTYKAPETADIEIGVRHKGYETMWGTMLMLPKEIWETGRELWRWVRRLRHGRAAMADGNAMLDDSPAPENSAA
jgi:sterol desaturase/sphingolipid hydroxylase (fatty acid hydroxylase superfamily)